MNPTEVRIDTITRSSVSPKPTIITRLQKNTRPPIPEKPIHFNYSSSSPTQTFAVTPFPTTSSPKSMLLNLFRNKKVPESENEPEIVSFMKKKNVLLTRLTND